MLEQGGQQFEHTYSFIDHSNSKGEEFQFKKRKTNVTLKVFIMSPLQIPRAGASKLYKFSNIDRNWVLEQPPRAEMLLAL